MPKTKPVYVIGHKNPDTDSICSAIAYAELKRQLGYEKVKAYRLGDINNETEFILNYFNIETPELLMDISPTLSDLDLYAPNPMNANEPLKSAWEFLTKSTGSRLLPVVDDEGIVGILALEDITNLFMEIADENLSENHDVLFKNLMNILEVTQVEGEYPYEKIEGKIFVGYAQDDISILTDKDVIITNNLKEAEMIAKKSACGCIIITDGLSIEKTTDKAGSTAIVSVSSSLIRTIGLLNQAVSIGSLTIDEELLSFSSDSYIDDVIEVVQASTYRNFPIVDRNGDIVGIMSRRHLIEYNKKRVILVDHNERSQSVDGIEQAEILEIIDHHRVADVQTDSPVFIRAEPLGSTATIIYKMFMESQAAINRKTAGLLLGAILSDTLKFLSPTATEDDKIAADRLATIAEVNIDDFAREMFKVGTSLQGFTTDELLALDMKKYNFGRYLTYISQVNTMDFKSVADMSKELMDRMEEFVHDNQCDLFILMVTNIVEGGTELLTAGRGKDLLFKAFGMGFDEDTIFLPDVVSRKKEIVPKLTIAAQ